MPTEEKACETFEKAGGKFVRAGRRLNYRPALFAAVALSFGIAFSFATVYLTTVHVCSISVAFFAFLAACAVFTGRVRVFRRVVVLIAAFAVGATAFSFYRAEYRSERHFGEKRVIARVSERADYANYTRFVFENLTFDGEEADGKLVVYCTKYATDEVKAFSNRAKEGDEAEFTANVNTNTAWRERSSDGEIRTRAYAWREDIRYETTDISEIRILGSNPTVFERLRFRLKNTLFSSVHEDAASICYALLTGATSQMDGELLENIRYGGVAHIFAVSGLHIGALFSFLSAIFRRKAFSSVPFAVRWTICAALLIFYGGFCGYSASVVRAIVMCLVFYADSLCGFKRDGAESLGLAACIVLLLSPVSLFDTGFLLSFSAAAGILFFEKPAERACNALIGKIEAKRREKKREKSENGSGEGSRDKTAANSEGVFGVASREGKATEEESVAREKEGRYASLIRTIGKKCLSLACVTFAATVATFPILSATFSYSSTAALFLNMLVVPIVSATFPVLAALAFLSCMLLPIAPYILYIPSLAITYFSTFFYAFDFSAFALEVTFPVGASVVYYVTLLFQGDKIRVSLKTRLIVLACGATACVLLLLL